MTPAGLRSADFDVTPCNVMYSKPYYYAFPTAGSWLQPVLLPLQGGNSRFMQAMGSSYARFTFIVAATLLTIHALDLQMTPNADPAHSAATTAKFFTGAGLL